MKLGVLLSLVLCVGCTAAPDGMTGRRGAASEDASMAEHSVGGKTAQEVFSDERLRMLAMSACEGRPDDVARLVKEGVDPNGTGLDGVTPLIWAQSCDSLAGMEALLQNGADPNKRFSRYNAIWLAADSHGAEQLELLIRHGGDVNFVADDGKTVLIAAFRRGHRGDWRNYELLLRSGADINKITNAAYLAGRETTIAEEEAGLNHYDRVVELLELGYNVRLQHIGRQIEVSVRDGAPISPAQAQWRARVREMLLERGVQFPVGPIE